MLWNQKCGCFDGYYELGESCERCAEKCETCVDNQCLKCSERRAIPPNCLCENGYYEDGEYECQECFELCQTCNEEFLCLTCKHGLYNHQGQCICQDNDKQFSAVSNSCI